MDSPTAVRAFDFPPQLDQAEIENRCARESFTWGPQGLWLLCGLIWLFYFLGATFPMWPGTRCLLAWAQPCWPRCPCATGCVGASGRRCSTLSAALPAAGVA